jgi:hypothetical protein
MQIKHEEVFKLAYKVNLIYQKFCRKNSHYSDPLDFNRDFLECIALDKEHDKFYADF